jgi:phosphoglycolate phosphatase-like HAD superfamily hydrolase
VLSSWVMQLLKPPAENKAHRLTPFANPGLGGVDMNSKPDIRLVITDLDNTLYDWVTFFARAFYAMVDEAVTILPVDRERLLDDLREVHIRYHNSEQPFALLETRTVQDALSGRSRRERYEILNPAFHAFNRVRANELKLYPSVADTLGKIHASGCRIVAHTEASAANAVFRLKKLDVLKYVDRLYAIEEFGEGHPDPSRESVLADVSDRIRLLRADERKPDVRVVFDICKDAGISPDHALYIGDSIARDIGMAKSAGAASAWAKYGTYYDRALWRDLVRITHWTQEDVLRAQKAQNDYGNAVPDVTLERMDELLPHFAFSP